MKLTLLFLIGLLSFGCTKQASTSSAPVATGPQQTAENGQSIVDEYLKRDAAPYRKERVRFTVTSEGERPDVYELDVWRRQRDSETATLSLMVKPPEDAGSGALAIETPDKPTVNITYSAARDEFRETDTSKMFFGGLTVQELLGEWSKYTYRSFGKRDLNGRAVFEVQGKLKDGKASTIDSLKVLFDAETYQPAAMHLFDNTGKELRTFIIKDVKTEGGHVYPGKTEVTNHVYGSQIIIEILERSYPEAIDDSYFSREKLKQSLRK